MIKIIFLLLMGVSLVGFTQNEKDSNITAKTLQTEELTVEKELSIDPVKETPKKKEVKKEIEKPSIPIIEKINIAAVGDIMMHLPQVTAGYNGKTKTYNFDSVFAPVRDYLEQADITIGNLETTLSGANKEYTGYPLFNSPDEIASALKNVGFDILTTSNNHSLDRRTYGVNRTLDVLDELELLHTGTARNKEERDKLLIVEVKGIKIAFMAYTYGTNGIPIEKEYQVNLIDKEKMLKDIAKAKKEKVDVICMSVHFGNEYQRKQNKKQEELVDFLFKNGVDIVLGSHPHVLQPMEMRTIKTVDGKDKEVFVIYSLGNFVSNQRDRYKDAGVILNIELQKNFDTGITTIEKVEYTPTWVDRSTINNKRGYRILPIESSLKDHKDKLDKLITNEDYNKMKQALEDTTSLLKSNDKIIHKK